MAVAEHRTPQDMTAEMFPNPGQALCQCRLGMQFYTLTGDLKSNHNLLIQSQGQMGQMTRAPTKFLIISQTNQQEKPSAFELVPLEV
jgi:hypothetical protein